MIKKWSLKIKKVQNWISQHFHNDSLKSTNFCLTHIMLGLVYSTQVPQRKWDNWDWKYSVSKFIWKIPGKYFEHWEILKVCTMRRSFQSYLFCFLIFWPKGLYLWTVLVCPKVFKSAYWYGLWSSGSILWIKLLIVLWMTLR